MLLASIIVTIVSTLVMIFVLRHPQPAPPKEDCRPKIERRIHRPHLPHIRRPRHDN